MVVRSRGLLLGMMMRSKWDDASIASLGKNSSDFGRICVMERFRKSHKSCCLDGEVIFPECFVPCCLHLREADGVSDTNNN